MRRRNELVLLPKLPLLTTESAADFDALRQAFERELEPRGIIEQMYVHDFCYIVWETQRLQRAKPAIINAAFRDALVHVLTECLEKPGGFQPLDLDDQVQTLALAWFKNEQGKKRVAKILNESGFGEYAIEGEAIRRSSSDLELLNRTLAWLEARRDKALRCIGEYRDRWGRQLRELSDRTIEEQNIPELVHVSSEESAA